MVTSRFRLAAAPLKDADRPEAELDVERLAAVLERWEVDCDPDRRNALHSTCDHYDQAESFARDYARLSPSQPAEESRK